MTNHKRRDSGPRSGYTLIEVLAVAAIIAVAAALVAPAFSGMSSTAALDAAAGQVASFVNHRAALARSGGGPSEIAVSGDSTVIATIPQETDESATSGANTVLGRNLLSGAQTNTKASAGDEEAAEVLELDGVKIEALYVRTASTGEARERLAVLSGGTCDDGLFVLSRGSVRTYVDVRGLAGRARVYDTLPRYIAGYFGVSGDETAKGK